MREDEAVPAAPLPRVRFARRTVVLEPGTSRPYDDAEWHDAIVMIEGGAVDLDCTAGGRRRFTAGAVLWLTGISLRTLHNAGVEPVVLVAVTRRRPDEQADGPP